jgi:hypothetical protein
MSKEETLITYPTKGGRPTLHSDIRARCLCEADQRASLEHASAHQANVVKVGQMRPGSARRGRARVPLRLIAGVNANADSHSRKLIILPGHLPRKETSANDTRSSVRWLRNRPGGHPTLGDSRLCHLSWCC